MSVDVTNETQWVIDPKVFSDLGIWVLDQMRVSTQSDLTIMFVDPDPIAELHMRWMNLEGPTDVMSFPMDELRPGTASKLTKLDFTFDDTAWMERRDKCRNRPLNINRLPQPGTAPCRRCYCSPSTASCTCSATTT